MNEPTNQQTNKQTLTFTIPPGEDKLTTVRSSMSFGTVLGCLEKMPAVEAVGYQ